MRRRSARGRRRGGGCKILHRGAKFLIPATSGVGFVIAAGGSMMATCAAAGAPLGAPPWCYTVISGGSRSARIYWVLARSIGLAERVGFVPLLSDARACGGRPVVGLVRRVSPLMPRKRHRQFFRLTALPEAVNSREVSFRPERSSVRRVLLLTPQSIDSIQSCC